MSVMEHIIFVFKLGVNLLRRNGRIDEDVGSSEKKERREKCLHIKQ